MNTLSEACDFLNQNPHLQAPLLLWLSHCKEALSSEDPPELDAYEAQNLEHLQALHSATMATALSRYDLQLPRLTYQGKLYRRQPPTRGHYHTMMGSLTLLRHTYRPVSGNGPAICPLELHSSMVLGTYTPRAAQFALALCAQMDYRSAEQVLEMGGQLGVSKSTLERDMMALSAVWQQEQEALDEAAFSQLELPKEALWLAVSVDRTGLPFEEPAARPVGRPKAGAPKQPAVVVHRQVYCASFTLYDAQGQSLKTWRMAQLPQQAQKLVARARAFCKRLFEALGRELGVVRLCDGAAEMRRMCDEIVEGWQVKGRLIDFWHAAGYVKQACQAMGVKASECDALVKKLRECKHGARKVLRQLSIWEDERGGGEAVEAALRYVRNHSEEMGYAKAQQEGMPIGSGHVEATCKCVVAVRFKRGGSRWKEAGAEGLLHARALWCSSGDAWKRGFKRLCQTYHQQVQPA